MLISVLKENRACDCQAIAPRFRPGKGEQAAPPEGDVHLILDNYATHKHPKVLRWLAQRPHFHLHFTPTSASWLNLVERFFRDLSQDVVLPGSFASVGELTTAI